MEGKNVIKELERLVKEYISLTLQDIRVEAAEEFDMNFQRQAFFNEKWARRKFNDDETRNILTGTGALRQSIIGQVEDDRVVFETTLPYASIHNEGGTITVTARMKGYFWRQYLNIVGTGKTKAENAPFNGKLQRRKNGKMRQNTKNRTLTAAAAFYRAMALKPVGSKIMIPKRQFIGMHPELERAILEITEKNAIKIFKQ